MLRNKSQKPITATNDPTTSDKINMGSHASGMYLVPAGVTAVAWYVALTANDVDPKPLYDDNNAAVSQTVTAGTWRRLPDDTFGAEFLVPVLTGSAEAALKLSLGT